MLDFSSSYHKALYQASQNLKEKWSFILTALLYSQSWRCPALNNLIDIYQQVYNKDKKAYNLTVTYGISCIGFAQKFYEQACKSKAYKLSFECNHEWWVVPVEIITSHNSQSSIQWVTHHGAMCTADHSSLVNFTN